MSDIDIQNLIQLAQDRLDRPPSVEQILATFVAAGILTQEGELTPPYQALSTQE
jgi:hypothetical protein